MKVLAVEAVPSTIVSLRTMSLRTTSRTPVMVVEVPISAEPEVFMAVKREPWPVSSCHRKGRSTPSLADLPGISERSSHRGSDVALLRVRRVDGTIRGPLKTQASGGHP